MHLQKYIMESYAHVPMSTRVAVAHAFNREEVPPTLMQCNSSKQQQKLQQQFAAVKWKQF